MDGTDSPSPRAPFPVFMGIVSLLLLSSCGADPTPKRTSVILISIDTLRADRLGSYGHPRATSPFLDRLARDGVRFDRAYTSAPWTVPAHMSMLTGNYPALYRRPVEEVTVENPQSFHHWLLDAAETTLAERFLEAGYDTAAFVDTPWLVPQLGFHQGFMKFDPEAGMNDKVDSDGGIRQVANRSLDWLTERDGDDPFFLFLHCFDVHGPFAPPSPFDQKFVGDAIYEGKKDRRYEVREGTDQFGVISAHLVAKDREDPENPTGFLDAQYDGGVGFVDQELERFFRRLDREGFLEECVVLITSDHGESLGEHDFFGHGVLYEQVMRIPMILSYPQKLPAGKVIKRPVNLVDVAPTLLELAGLPSERGFHGNSLVNLVRGDESKEENDPVYYLEGGIRKQYALVSRDWKYILHFPQVGEDMEGWLEDLSKVDPEGNLGRIDQLFDLKKDPQESQNQSSIKESRFPDLVEFNSRLRKDWESFQIRRSAHGKPDDFDGDSGTLSESAIQRLKELGYLYSNQPESGNPKN